MVRIVLAVILLGIAPDAWAQDTPGFPNVAPLPPPILPKIEIPPIPKLDELPRQPSSARPQPTFQDRAIHCQMEAGAAGLNAADQGRYTRACANQ